MTRALALAILVALAACAGTGSGPRWPESAGTVPVEEWQDDGGQSLAPRAGTPAVEAAADRRAEPDLLELLVTPQQGPSSSDAGATDTATERELQEALDAIELPESIIIEIED